MAVKGIVEKQLLRADTGDADLEPHPALIVPGIAALASVHAKVFDNHPQ